MNDVARTVLRRFMDLCPADPAVVEARAMGIVALVIGFLFFGVGGTPATLMMVLLIIAAALATLDSIGRHAIFRMPGTAPVRWMPVWHGALLACLLWQVAGWLLIRPGDLATMRTIAGTLSVIAFVLLAGVAVRLKGRWGSRLLLELLFWMGSVSAAVSLVVYSWRVWSSGETVMSAVASMRLVPIGRADHEIAGAVALAVALFAGLATVRERKGPYLAAGIVGLLTIALVIALTQSRGPVLGLLLAPVFALAILRVRSQPVRNWLVPVGLAAGFALPILLIIFERQIKALVCAGDAVLCRGSNRLELWAYAVDGIMKSPLLGAGPAATVSVETGGHPHNMLLGMAFYFGVPIALPLIVIYLAAARRAARLDRGPMQGFVLMGLMFAAINLATERPNIFGDLNSHLLYVWLPVALAFSLPRKT